MKDTRNVSWCVKHLISRVKFLSIDSNTTKTTRQEVAVTSSENHLTESPREDVNVNASSPSEILLVSSFKLFWKS